VNYFFLQNSHLALVQSLIDRKTLLAEVSSLGVEIG
jgi:hypothetical protein